MLVVRFDSKLLACLVLWGSADARGRGLELKVDSRVTIKVEGWEAVDKARGS